MKFIFHNKLTFQWSTTQLLNKEQFLLCQRHLTIRKSTPKLNKCIPSVQLTFLHPKISLLKGFRPTQYQYFTTDKNKSCTYQMICFAAFQCSSCGSCMNLETAPNAYESSGLECVRYNKISTSCLYSVLSTSGVSSPSSLQTPDRKGVGADLQSIM